LNLRADGCMLRRGGEKGLRMCLQSSGCRLIRLEIYIVSSPVFPLFRSGKNGLDKGLLMRAQRALN